MTSPNMSACHVVDGSPSKVAPQTVHSRTIGLPGPNIAAIPSPPLPQMVPTLAWCSASLSTLISLPGGMKLTNQP